MIRGSRYLVTVDDEKNGNKTESIITIMLKSGNTFKVKNRFSASKSGNTGSNLIQHINSKNMLNVLVASKYYLNH